MPREELVVQSIPPAGLGASTVLPPSDGNKVVHDPSRRTFLYVLAVLDTTITIQVPALLDGLPIENRVVSITGGLVTSVPLGRPIYVQSDGYNYIDYEDFSAVRVAAMRLAE